MMNCNHTGEGWCLACVGALEQERERLQQENEHQVKLIDSMHKQLDSWVARDKVMRVVLDTLIDNIPPMSPEIRNFFLEARSLNYNPSPAGLQIQTMGNSHHGD